MRLAWMVWTLTLLASPMAQAQTSRTPSIPKRLTLDGAIAIAKAQHPSLRQSRAEIAIARAQADEARSPLLPSLTASGNYQRTTSNFVIRPGVIPESIMLPSTSPSFDSINFYDAAATLSYRLFDFGQSRARWHAAKSAASAQSHSHQVTQHQVAFAVRSAYCRAWASQSLIQVAREALDNEQRHLDQIEAFVNEGTRARIDLERGLTSLANAQVALIRADNDHLVARAELELAMGVVGPLDFELTEPSFAPIAGEDDALEALVTQASRARPEIAAIARQSQAKAQEAQAAHRAHFPVLSASAQVTEAGAAFEELTWNWSIGVNLTWSIFEGGRVAAQASAATWQRESIGAQETALRQQVRLEVMRAFWATRASKAMKAAAEQAVRSARALLEQAEARYRNGVGSVIELDDAQLAVTSAETQRVQADYELALARAALLFSLGALAPSAE